MSNKFFKLTAIQLKGVLMTNQFNSGTKKQKTGKLIFVTAMFALMALLFILYCSLFTYAYITIGLTEAVMPLIMAVSSVFIIMTTIFKANGFLFASKDDDLLMSLPIQTKDIILSRFVSLYLFEAAITALMVIPSLIVWLVCLGFDAAVFIKGLFSVLFIPMIPLAIAALIGIVITYISARFKYKNLVMIILGMAGLLAIMYFSMNVGNINTSDFTEINTMLLSIIVSIYPPAKLFAMGINGNLFAYVGLIILSVIIFSAVIAVITVNFKKLTTLLSSHRTKSHYKMETLKTSGVLTSLIVKEFKRYFSLSSYVLNTAFSMLLMLVFAIAIFFIDDIEVLINIPGATRQLQSFIPVICLFFMALSSTTYPCISLEGEQVWLTASLPVDSKTIYLSKIMMNLILSMPVCLISTILFIIRFKPDITYSIITVLVPAACGIFMAFFGLAVNLKFPNFQWVNATSVIKQGAGGTICSIGGLIIVFGCGALILMTDISKILIYGILFACFVLGTFISWQIARKTPLIDLISR